MVDKLPPMIDMRHTPEEIEEEYSPPSVQDAPAYPFGLCISFGQDELDKLGLEPDDLDVGDMLHLFAFAVVTSKSVHEREGSDPCVRIECQITHLSGESEDEENEEQDEEESEPTSKLYRR